MKISDRIYNLIYTHKSDLGNHPDTIYLGQEEYMSLMNETFEYGSPIDHYSRKCFGIEFFDLPVKNHLNISFTKK